MCNATEQMKDVAHRLPDLFIKEVDRLLNSGGLGDDFNNNAVYKVAIENISGSLFRINSNDKDYKNLKHF